MSSVPRAGVQVRSGSNRARRLGRRYRGERRPVTTRKSQSPTSRSSGFHSNGPSKWVGIRRAESSEKPRPRLPTLELPRPNLPVYLPHDHAGATAVLAEKQGLLSARQPTPMAQPVSHSNAPCCTTAPAEGQSCRVCTLPGFARILTRSLLPRLSPGQRAVLCAASAPGLTTRPRTPTEDGS